MGISGYHVYLVIVVQVYTDVFHALLNCHEASRQAPGEVATCNTGAEGFSVRENDYCWGDKKIAGNAQAIIKDRWLHHTSFLWDFQRERMSLLQEPDRRPKYRGQRKHANFLTPLRTFGFRRRDFLEIIEDCVAIRGFDVNLIGAPHHAHAENSRIAIHAHRVFHVLHAAVISIGVLMVNVSAVHTVS